MTNEQTIQPVTAAPFTGPTLELSDRVKAIKAEIKAKLDEKNKK